MKRPRRTHITVASALEGQHGDHVILPAVRISDFSYGRLEETGTLVALMTFSDLSGPDGRRESIPAYLVLSDVDGDPEDGDFLEIGIGLLAFSPERAIPLLIATDMEKSKVIERPVDWNEDLRLVESAG